VTASGSHNRVSWWQTITFKVMGGTALLMIAITGALAGFSIREQQRLEVEQVEESVSLVADAALHSFSVSPRIASASSTHYAELEATVGDLAPVRNLRVVSVEGLITFSRQADEVGTPFQPAVQRPCAGCHARALPETDTAEFSAPDGTPSITAWSRFRTRRNATAVTDRNSRRSARC